MFSWLQRGTGAKFEYRYSNIFGDIINFVMYDSDFLT